MRKITFSADAKWIERARTLARAQGMTLTTVLREWLANFATRSAGDTEYDALLNRLKRVNAGRKFTRDEMNER